jgi:error-prone DNA polymerase
MGFSLDHHLVAHVRLSLEAKRYRSAQALLGTRHGQLVRVCGLVTLRQRPHSARGVMFLTLEDETGQVNVIIKPGLLERERQALLGSTMLGVIGTWQTDGQVHNLLAGRIEDETALLWAQFRD